LQIVLILLCGLYFRAEMMVLLHFLQHYEKPTLFVDNHFNGV